MSASVAVAAAWMAARCRAESVGVRMGRISSFTAALVAEELLAAGVVFPPACWNCGGPVGERPMRTGDRELCAECWDPCGSGVDNTA